MVERDERGREIVYVNRIPRLPQWNKHINNCVEDGKMDQKYMNELVQFIYDYPQLTFLPQDFQKRKRVKNIVPFFERCCALRANGEQCTRRRKDESIFCGTHIKGTPHGVITDKPPKKTHKETVIINRITGKLEHVTYHDLNLKDAKVETLYYNCKKAVQKF